MISSCGNLWHSEFLMTAVAQASVFQLLARVLSRIFFFDSFSLSSTGCQWNYYLLDIVILLIFLYFCHALNGHWPGTPATVSDSLCLIAYWKLCQSHSERGAIVAPIDKYQDVHKYLVRTGFEHWNLHSTGKKIKRNLVNRLLFCKW